MGRTRDDDDDDTMLEDYLDCAGKRRRFRLQGYALGMFLDATEMLPGDAMGMRS